MSSLASQCFSTAIACTTSSITDAPQRPSSVTLFLLVLLVLLGNCISLFVYQPLLSHNPECIMKRIQIRTRRPMRLEVVVGPCKVLPVIDSEIHVMQCVVGRAVDILLKPVARDHVTIMDENCPHLHQNEKNHIQVLLHRANEDKHTITTLKDRPQWSPQDTSNSLIREGLNISIEWVKSQSCPRSRHYVVLARKRWNSLPGVCAYQSTCGVACECTCKHWGGAQADESSKS